ncbi:hypothetical protein LSTR_LSTR003613 [Laodelphax striatellus]|uniref:Peptidase S1 domain-containing protein n=1 Tax=Laodelphax striatellus TaxID=195883 RepID=A0A482WL33_LAOST|nr:hypothetical protein LSTR_LSTR003613 [Laodelphax striatellus]
MEILTYIIVVMTISLVKGAFDPHRNGLVWHRNWKKIDVPDCGYKPGYHKHSSGYSKQARPGQFPWLVQIFIHDPGAPKNHQCMGAIISWRFILTAQQCFQGYGSEPISPNSLYVKVGEWDLSTDPDCMDWGCAPPTKIYQVEKVILYNDTTAAQHIALIKTKRFMFFNDFVGPICMEHGDMLQVDFTGKNGNWVTGWGKNAQDFTQNNRTTALTNLKIISAYDKPKLFNGDKESVFILETPGYSHHIGETGGPVSVNPARLSDGDYDDREYLHGIKTSTLAITNEDDSKFSICNYVPYYLEWILEQMDPDRTDLFFS